jgi:hypothetical protein
MNYKANEAPYSVSIASDTYFAQCVKGDYALCDPAAPLKVGEWAHYGDKVGFKRFSDGDEAIAAKVISVWRNLDTDEQRAANLKRIFSIGE